MSKRATSELAIQNLRCRASGTPRSFTKAFAASNAGPFSSSQRFSLAAATSNASPRSHAREIFTSRAFASLSNAESSEILVARRVREGVALSAKPFGFRSEEHTSELQSLMRISYAVFCLKKQNAHKHKHE